VAAAERYRPARQQRDILQIGYQLVYAAGAGPSTADQARRSRHLKLHDIGNTVARARELAQLARHS